NLDSQTKQLATNEYSNNLWQQLDLTREHIKNISAINLVGAGTSHHASQIAQFFFETVCKIPTSAIFSSELEDKPFLYHSNTLHILFSQSGETADTLEALAYIKAHNQSTLAITNVAPSTMTREAGGFFHMQAGPELSVPSTKVFSSQPATLYWLAH